MPINSMSDKKKVLLAHKEKLLQDIKYYEKRLEDFGANASSHAYFEEGCSTDLEDDFPTTINIEPTVPQLKIKQSMLKTCLQATQELTNLLVLQSETNVMVEDPVIEGELPVKEPGLWREVTAECRIDLVPFSVMFHVHEPTRKFAATSYRGLKVLVVKTTHEAELAKSLLPGISRPSEAVQILRSYAVAYRSRRTTLSRLADKFANNLFMEPLAEGGYLLKCANLLEVSWRLENKWSPIAAFHHRMKFDLEYMDESYIKIITQAHKQLADPSIETDERTLLLSKIISTCLEAQGPTQELYESMESDQESVKNLEKRRMTLDQDIEAPVVKKKRDGNTINDIDIEKAKDDQIMAPPKSLPKKGKPKGKENMNENRKSVKRSNVDEGSCNVKKAKTDVRPSVSNQTEETAIKSKANSSDNQKKDSIIDTDKNKAVISTGQRNIEEESENTEKNKNLKKTKTKQDPTDKIVSEGTAKNNDKPQNSNVQEETIDVNEVEERKRATVKEPVKQKVGIKKKHVANSKNDPKSKEAETDKAASSAKFGATSKNDPKPKESSEKAASKSKMVASSKNYPESKDLEAQKQDGQDKKTISSKNDPKTKESETKKVAKANKMTVNLKNDPPTAEKNSKKNNTNATQKLAHKETPVKDDNSKKSVIVSKNNDKRSKKVKSVATNAKDNDKILKNDNENANKVKKPDMNTGSASENKKAVISQQSNTDAKKNAVNKELNIQNVKKDNTNKEINTKTAKASKIENTMSNNEKNNENNKPDGTNVEKLAKLKNNGGNSETVPPPTKEAHVQKSKATVKTKNADKNSVNPKTVDEMVTKKTNNPSKTKISDKETENDTNKKSASNGKGDTVEKVAKVKNVAIKNKEHIVDRTDNAANFKKPDAKISKPKNVLNKMVIKNLSNTNASAQNKLKRKSSSGNTENVKVGKSITGSIANNFKVDNTMKDNGSASKISRIPQKKLLSPISESALKKNPLRISPRKLPSTFKSASDSNIKKNAPVKLVTNIPRLTKKPQPKSKLY